MSTLLWSPVFPQGDGFAIPRAYQWGFDFSWVKHHIVSYGRTTVIEEEVFGGYRVVMAWKASYWDWSTKSNTINFPWETFYALAPGSTTPINVGTVSIQWRLEPTYHVPMIGMVLAGSDNHFSVYRFPAAPPTYYGPAFPPVRATPFLSP